MNEARAVVGMDRLPWLTDEPKPPARANSSVRELLGWAVAGLLLVAGFSYWLGMRVAREPDESSLPTQAEATVKLPQVRDNVQRQVSTIGTQEIGSASPPAAAAPPKNPTRRTSAAPVRKRRTLSSMDMKDSKLRETVAEQKAAPTKPAAKITRPQPLRLWPAQRSQGASGRIVRIGAFGSREQAKLGWRRMQRVYPAVGRLPATVVTDRNSRGRVFYRFQIGTTSQAHSEVLCQRMATIRFSCAVLGLPWKAKVER